MKQSPLRIAVVSPLFESVPPKLYGGTERVISWLTEELVRQGHSVTLFASADSVTQAHLRPAPQRATRLDPDCRDPWPAHVLMLDEVIESARQFDVVHFHTEHFHLPFARHLKIPAITTLHGRLDLPELVPLYRRFRDAPLVSISEAQRAPLPFANWIGMVHHGLPADRLSASEKPGTYLAFLGRMSPEKGPESAIRIARRAGVALKMAAKIDRADEEYFRRAVKPLLGRGVEFVGEIGDRDKNEFLGGAMALLFPIGWPEPFGLAMIESMACGTPVIAYARGSVPEVVQHAVTGCLVDDEDRAVEAVRRIHEFDRAGCRRAFEERFTADRMARDYVQLYRGVHQVHELGRKLAASRAARREVEAVEPPALLPGSAHALGLRVR
jgi:glycosyltransferase involved in cell wall biosynthesis